MTCWKFTRRILLDLLDTKTVEASAATPGLNTVNCTHVDCPQLVPDPQRKRTFWRGSRLAKNMATVTRLATAVSMDKKPAAGASSSDEEEFADAMEDIEAETIEPADLACPMTLSESLEQCEVALNLFLNNDLHGAMQLMRPWSQSSLYHSLATAIFEFIPAVLTLDARQVAAALLAIKRTLALCQQHRRTYTLVESLGTIIKKKFSSFTEVEAHAELCYAEALLLQAALSLLEGEDLAGLVRATMRVKYSHTSYKTCARILEQRCWEDGRSRRDFGSGVHLGLGAFQYIVSMLPARLAALLTFAGFDGNRRAGLEELRLGSRAGGLRAPLCDLTLLAVQLVVGHFVAAPPDMCLVSSILDRRLHQYPNGAWFMLFLGRLHLIRGRTVEALAAYARVAAVPRLWPQLTHLTYWECMWANGVDLQWREAAECAGRLLAESAWSRAVYAYTRAAFLLQLSDAAPHELHDAHALLRSAASYRQRIAGKSLPMEKFVARRCARWAAGGTLLLPALELLCLWNMFPALVARISRTYRALQIIEKAEEELKNSKVEGECGRRRGGDGEALLRLLRGALLAAAGRPRLALAPLNTVVEMRNLILEDSFLVPYAMYEIACCHISLGDRVRGQALLREIRRNYSGFLLESRLQFRLHDRLARVSELPAEEEAAERDDRTHRAHTSHSTHTTHTAHTTHGAHTTHTQRRRAPSPPSPPAPAAPAAPERSADVDEADEAEEDEEFELARDVD